MLDGMDACKQSEMCMISKADAICYLAAGINSDSAAVEGILHFLPRQFFAFAHKNNVFPRPPSFFPISVTTALTKTLTYPGILGVHTLTATARFMTYPKV